MTDTAENQEMPFSVSSASTSVTVAEHLHPYQVPPASFSEYFVENDGDKPNQPLRSRLVASAVVIHSGRVLLLQRAAHNFQPLLWELPGGRCESRDETVISSAVRELREESGLIARRVIDIVGEYEWLDRGEAWKKITFLVDVDINTDIDPSVEQSQSESRDGSDAGQNSSSPSPPKVTLDPNEQAGFLWATEGDVIANQCGEVSLSWTSNEQKQTVLDAFTCLRRSAK